MSVAGERNDGQRSKGEIVEVLFRRLKGFVRSNGTVFAMSVLLQVGFGKRVKTAGVGQKFLTVLCAVLLKMTAFVKLISWSATHKEPILGEKRTKTASEADHWSLYKQAFIAAVGETISIMLSMKYITKAAIKPKSLLDYVKWYIGFVKKSFVYEVIFDFFHYWTHRWCHQIPSLYRFHKVHHKFLHPTPLTTFQQHPFDIIFTNIVPNSLTMKIIVDKFGLSFSPFELNLLFAYKMFVEIAGHAGIHTNATSFPQCAPLPKLFGFEMQTVDHDLHHSFPSKSCNYSKRFTLWDRMFSTHQTTINK